MAKLIIGLKGSTTLTEEEQQYLADPRVAGAILFARNYQDRQQLIRLVQQIRQVRKDLLITVDHEGGRVQRFRHEFTVLPAASHLAKLYQEQPSQALSLAKACGSLMAHELQACDIDFSYAPVLDLDYGVSDIIGNRSFGRDPLQVAALAGAVIEGLAENGMANVGKHYPGHGGVAADSHGEIVVDDRSEAELSEDILAFKLLINKGLKAIMPAHVIYPRIDKYPAGFSKILLQDWLRDKLGFEGAIISDDLGMHGATAVGGLEEQLSRAIEAGCDLILMCNDPEAVKRAMHIMPLIDDATCNARITQLRRSGSQTIEDFDNAAAQRWRQQLSILN